MEWRVLIKERRFATKLEMVQPYKENKFEIKGETAGNYEFIPDDDNLVFKDPKVITCNSGETKSNVSLTAVPKNN